MKIYRAISVANKYLWEKNCDHLCEIYLNGLFSYDLRGWDNLPNPKCAFKPPRFLTRNNPDFLKAQLTTIPKSVSRTQVPWAVPRKYKRENKLIGKCPLALFSSVFWQVQNHIIILRNKLWHKLLFISVHISLLCCIYFLKMLNNCHYSIKFEINHLV